MAASVSTAQASDLQAETREAIDVGYAPRLPSKLAGSMRSEFQQVLAIGGVASDRINFLVPEASSSSGGWIDLRESYIHLRLAIRKQGSLVADPQTLANQVTATGFNLKRASEVVSPETSFVHTLWRRIRTYLGSVDVSDDDAGYAHWPAFVRDALMEDPSYGDSHSRTTVSFAGGIPAAGQLIPGAFTELDYAPDDKNGDGWQKFTVYPGSTGDGGNYPTRSQQRMTLLWRVGDVGRNAGSTGTGLPIIEVIMKPKSGVWNCPFYLPPNTSIRYEMEKNNDVMNFRGPRAPGQIDGFIDWSASEATMFLCRRYPERAVAEALAAESLSASFMYPFLRSRTHVSTHQASESSVNITGLLAGPRPALVTIGVLDTYALTKPIVGGQGGQQFSAFQASGASRPDMFFNPGFNSNELWSAPPHVTDIQVRWGSRSVPLVPYRQPTSHEVTRAYEEYRRVSNGALSYGAFQGAYTVYCFDLTDSGTAKLTLAGEHSDMGDGDRGSLEVYAQFVKNESTAISAPGRTFSLMITGWGTAAAAISPATGTVRRLGF